MSRIGSFLITLNLRARRRNGEQKMTCA